MPGSRLLPPGDYIARIKVQGLIRGNQDRVEALERLGQVARARGDRAYQQPGGTTAGSEQLYDSLRALQAKKPMVVVVDGLAASGAYIAALASDHIIAQDTSLVGSIGVLFQYPNFTELLKTIGIQVEEIKSSPLKAAPNGFEPTSPEARAAIEAIVLDSYAWFKGLVKDRRKLDDAQLAAVDDGRVFTGRQGVGLKLVDGLGNEKTAMAWLEKEKKVRPRRRCAITRWSRDSASFPSCMSRPGPSRRWASPPWRTASRRGVRCRRSSDLILTVSWRFGTLHPPTDP